MARIRASYLAQAGYGTELKIHDQLEARVLPGRLLARLARPPEPLIQVAGGARFVYPPRVPDGAEFAAQCLVPSARGREILDNGNDAITLRGIDCCMGGSHLRPHSVWRWDGEKQRLVAPKAA